MQALKNFVLAWWAIMAGSAEEVFDRAGTAYTQHRYKLKWLTISASCLIVFSFFASILGIYGLVHGWQVSFFLGTALVSLCLGFAIIGILIQLISWIVLSGELLKAGMVDPQIELVRKGLNQLGGLTSWTMTTIESAVKLIAAAVPGVSAEEVRNAFSSTKALPKQQNDLPEIFTSLRQAMEKISEKAKIATRIMKDAFFIWACTLLDFLIATALIRNGHLEDPALFWKSVPGLSVTVFLGILVIWQIIRPTPKPLPGIIWHFRVLGMILAIILMFEGAGFLISTNKVLAAKIQKINASQIIASKKINLETDLLEQGLKVVALGDYAPLDTTGVPMDSVVITNGSVWRVQNDSFVIGSRKFWQVYQGYKGTAVTYIAEPGWFRIWDSKTTIPGPQPNSGQFSYSTTAGPQTVVKVGSGKTVVVYAENRDYYWNSNNNPGPNDPPKICNPGGTVGFSPLSWAKQEEYDTSWVKAYPAPTLPFGALLVRSSPDSSWKLLGLGREEFSGPGEIQVTINSSRPQNGGGFITVHWVFKNSGS